MPSVLDTVDVNIRKELDERLLNSGFTDYRGLVEWLNEKGIEVGLGQVGRHAKSLKDRMNKVRESGLQAQAFITSCGDTTESMHEATHALILHSCFEIINDDSEKKVEELAKLAQAVARLTASGVGLKRYQDSVRKQKEDASQKVESTLKKGGLSSATIESVKRQILGIGA